MIISTVCSIVLGSDGPAVLDLSGESPTPKADADPGSVSQPTWLHLTLLLRLQDRLLIREKRWGWVGEVLAILGNERPERIAEDVERPVLPQGKKIGGWA